MRRIVYKVFCCNGACMLDKVQNSALLISENLPDMTLLTVHEQIFSSYK